MLESQKMALFLHNNTKVMFMILLGDNDYRQIILKRRNILKSIITDSEENGLLHYQDQPPSFLKI